MAFDVAALVERRHGLVCGSNLNLHEVGLPVAAIRACHWGAVNILPSILSTEDIVHFFVLQLQFLAYLSVDDVDIRTSRAEVAKAAIHGGILY